MTRLVVVAFVAALAFPSAAGAFTATAATAPGTVTYFGAADPRTTSELVQRLEIQAGPNDEELVLTVSRDLGPPSPGALRIDGPGTLGPPHSLGASGTSSTTGEQDPCQYGPYSFDHVRFELHLPGGTRSTISFTQPLKQTRVPDYASAFVQRWELAPEPAGGPDASTIELPGAVTVTSPAPKLAGLKVVLRVGLVGSAGTIGYRQMLAMTSGSTVLLSGFVNRARRHDTVTIWGFAPDAKTAKPLGRARLDRHHRFWLPWRVDMPGLWQLYAAYSPRPGLVTARSHCSGPRLLVSD